jgi:CBS domain-containing membrane protein
MPMATISPLNWTAADVMSRDVQVIPKHMSLRAAAHLLARSQVSGAPVTDDQGRCVGVLSRTDLIRWMDGGDGAAKRIAGDSECVCSDWQMCPLDEVPEEEVSQYMTADLVAARPDTPLGQLARWMLDAHIHRIVILDGLRRPVGVVTSTDILAAVANSNAPGEFE